MKIIIDPQKCHASGHCIKVCPLDAISIKNGLAEIDASKCDFDGMCIPACPHGAIGYIPEE